MKLRIVSVFFLFCSSVYAGNVYIKSDPPRVGILSFKLLKLAQDEDQDGHAFLLELDDDSGGWELPVPDNNRLVYSNITGEIEITWYVSPKGDGAYDAYKCRSTKLKVNEGDNITVTLRRGLFDYNTKILESENKPNDHAEYFDALFDFRLNVQIQKRKKEEDQLSIKIQEEKEQQQEREKELLFNKQIEKINNGKIVDYDIFGFKIGQSMKTCLDEIKKSKIKYSYSEDKKAILLESLLVENPLMKSMRLNFENMILESIIVFPIESVEIETINEILKEKYSFERYKPIFEHETLMLGEMSVSKTGQQYYYTIKKFDIEVELLKSSSAVNQYFFRKDIFYIWFKKKDKSVESGF